MLCACSDEDEPMGVDAGVVLDGASDVDAGSPGTPEPDGGSGGDGGSADAGVSDGPADLGGPPLQTWVQFEPDGAVCADGSPYKYFVNFAEGTSDVIVFFEGGGACWDYASCVEGAVRSAANLDGIPDGYADELTEFGGFSIPVDIFFPLLSRDSSVGPFSDWNQVFLPYCTGDVFSGDRMVTYVDPAAVQPSVEIHHRGRANTLLVVEQLRDLFPATDRLFVAGCSAGGAGAVSNYAVLRDGLSPRKGFLLNDSGPIFPDQAPSAWSLPLHDRVREAWNLSPLIQSLPDASAVELDFGAISSVLADAFPDDRLAQTFFRLDYDYSLYSYERFYERTDSGEVQLFADGMGLGGIGLDMSDPQDRAVVYRLWWDDTDLLREQYDGKANLGYFLPFYRTTQNSHCTTIPGFEEFDPLEVVTRFLTDFASIAWAGTEIELQDGEVVNLRGYVDQLLDEDVPVPSFFETDGEGPFVPCTPDALDPDACAEAAD